VRDGYRPAAPASRAQQSSQKPAPARTTASRARRSLAYVSLRRVAWHLLRAMKRRSARPLRPSRRIRRAPARWTGTQARARARGETQQTRVAENVGRSHGTFGNTVRHGPLPCIRSLNDNGGEKRAGGPAAVAQNRRPSQICGLERVAGHGIIALRRSSSADLHRPRRASCSCIGSLRLLQAVERCAEHRPRHAQPLIAIERTEFVGIEKGKIQFAVLST
jgi:hypothetical protein